MSPTNSYLGAYQYGTATVMLEEWGGHTVQQECTSEDDARARVEHWQRNQARRPSSSVADMYLIRRPIGDWERA